jgi:hypothetical protein
VAETRKPSVCSKLDRETKRRLFVELHRHMMVVPCDVSLCDDGTVSELKDLVLRQDNSTIIAGYSRYLYLVKAVFLQVFDRNYLIHEAPAILKKNAEKLEQVIPRLFESAYDDLADNIDSLILTSLKDFYACETDDLSQLTPEQVSEYFKRIQLAGNIEAEITVALEALIDSVVEQQRNIFHLLFRHHAQNNESLSSSSSGGAEGSSLHSVATDATESVTDWQPLSKAVEERVQTAVGLLSSQYDLKLQEWKEKLMKHCKGPLGETLLALVKSAPKSLKKQLSMCSQQEEDSDAAKEQWDDFAMAIRKRIADRLLSGRKSIRTLASSWLKTTLKNELVHESGVQLKLLAQESSVSEAESREFQKKVSNLITYIRRNVKQYALLPASISSIHTLITR